MRYGRRRGYTWIEVLTVLCAAVLLVLVLVPAILAARQAERANTCRRNLKMIGLALHNYHDAHRTFPPGWVSRNARLPTGQGLGWMTSILPFVQHRNTYRQINPDGFGLADIVTEKQVEAVKTPIATYRCPSDPTPAHNPFRGDWPTSNYTGNAGHRPLPRWIAATTNNFWPGQVLAPTDPRELSGVFAVNSKVRIRDISDGTSHTILVAERSVTSGAGIWPGLRSNSQENDLVTDGSHASRPNRGFRSCSSEHGVINVLTGDGAVHRLDPNVDSRPNSDPEEALGILQRFFARNDSQIASF